MIEEFFAALDGILPRPETAGIKAQGCALTGDLEGWFLDYHFTDGGGVDVVVSHPCGWSQPLYVTRADLPGLAGQVYDAACIPPSGPAPDPGDCDHRRHNLRNAQAAVEELRGQLDGIAATSRRLVRTLSRTNGPIPGWVYNLTRPQRLIGQDDGQASPLEELLQTLDAETGIDMAGNS